MRGFSGGGVVANHRSPPGGPTEFRLYFLYLLTWQIDANKKKKTHSHSQPLPHRQTFRPPKNSGAAIAICCSTSSCPHELCALTALSAHSPVRLPACAETQPFQLCFFFFSIYYIFNLLLSSAAAFGVKDYRGQIVNVHGLG